ncbi:MAG TPA: glycoside hydrolase 100 family protein [Ignavibacteriaceae bacterium]|nr:glycoside hydrolase 100 family protein [Ignavibacteriaceae bacterium]
MLDEAWKLLNGSVAEFKGKPVGTLAAVDKTTADLNYDQVFVRDFAVSAFAFLLNNEDEIVRNFLELTLELQIKQHRMDCFVAGKGIMPASFKISKSASEEEIIPDYGEKAIAKVAPVDSVFWWMYILRAYVKKTGDLDFAHRKECQNAIKLILELALTTRFDMFPTLLVPDGSFMIDRRMGVYGYPLEIQALFYISLMTAREFLINNSENKSLIDLVIRRIGHLKYHLRKYFWLDFKKLNQIYRYQIEEYEENALNQFNVFPASIPSWVYNWLSDNDGYFVGGLGPSRMDFRFFTAGNLLSVLGSLADDKQAQSIMKLLLNHEKELVGEMPLKLCYPALKGVEWELLTGFDSKNIPWSYHNGGSWPFLLWSFAAASIKLKSTKHLNEIISIAEKRLASDHWPEYYDGVHNKLIGKEARCYQTWTIAGYLVAKTLLKEPHKIGILTFDE